MSKCLAAFLLLCGLVLAEGPPVTAIRNARIVTVSGPVIAKGTVVIHSGLIEAVGENVAIPAGAWVIDGEGMTVYPGLIDALSTVGMPGEAPAAATAGRGGGRGQTTTPATTAPAATQPAAPRSMGPEDRPQTTSWLLAADEISPADRRIETVRSGGITTTATYPTRGIFAGQGSLIDLAATEKAGEMVVVPSLGQYISVTRTGGVGGGGFGSGFPGALMGYIAYIRQIYLDADHYKLVKDAYAKDRAAWSARNTTVRSRA